MPREPDAAGPDKLLSYRYLVKLAALGALLNPAGNLEEPLIALEQSHHTFHLIALAGPLQKVGKGELGLILDLRLQVKPSDTAGVLCTREHLHAPFIECFTSPCSTFIFKNRRWHRPCCLVDYHQNVPICVEKTTWLVPNETAK